MKREEQAMSKKSVPDKAGTAKVSLRTLRTGVPGLDAVLGGGLPELSFNLIVGGPGGGKTTLAMAIMFANVTREMRIAKEEIFGPVLSILTYKTEAEAIEIANDTEFGLIAYVSSADPERATRVARKLAAGRVLINTLSHDPFAPFGGFKQSGIGREGGIFGLQEYLEPKAIIG
jgi:acyl-CoA reductase-like NAD-dependent aldehyde dehydrogenase